MMPPSPQIKTAISVKAPEITNIPRSLDGPDELCRPMTLLLFQDTVKTRHGQTYELDAIASMRARR